MASTFSGKDARVGGSVFGIGVDGGHTRIKRAGVVQCGGPIDR
jgi:hypothetical protein